MFINKYDLKSVVELYQIEEYTGGDDVHLDMAINTAIEEVRGYLSRYDTDKIFSASGSQRSPLVLEITKIVTLYYMAQKCNVDIVFENVKSRYDNAIKKLLDINKGVLNPGFPTIKNTDGTSNVMFACGSNKKLCRTDEY
ncbi:MAG: phage protein Gp36 family protein [Rikenellaceae bacterium]